MSVGVRLRPKQCSGSGVFLRAPMRASLNVPETQIRWYRKKWAQWAARVLIITSVMLIITIIVAPRLHQHWTSFQKMTSQNAVGVLCISPIITQLELKIGCDDTNMCTTMSRASNGMRNSWSPDEEFEETTDFKCSVSKTVGSRIDDSIASIICSQPINLLWNGVTKQNYQWCFRENFEMHKGFAS